MIKLTKEEQADLKSLKTKPWFKVMIKLIENFELTVFRQLKTTDLKDDKQLGTLGRNMDYLKGIEDVMNTLKTWTNQIAERKIEKDEEE